MATFYALILCYVIYRPPDAHAVDFPATFDVDFGNTVRDNAAAGSTRLGFQYAGEECLENDASPTNNQVINICPGSHS